MVTTAIAAVMVLAQSASAQLLESWEGSLDGWTVQNANYIYAPATKFGVTDGTFSASLTGLAGPNYGQMLLSPYEASWTAEIGGATSMSLDVYTPNASFGYYCQFQLGLVNNDTGYVALNPVYTGTGIGSETTITVPISPSVAATLAASSNPTQLFIQIGGGYTAGNETMYLDNLRVVPEPSTFALLGFGVLGLVGVARRRRS
jgi:hypothetical protein